jgi:type VI secretion system protein ImpK
MNDMIKSSQIINIEDKNDYLAEISRELLYLIALLRQKKYEVKTSQLSNLLLEKIEDFTNTMNKMNFNPNQLDNAKYLICAALDEASSNLSNSTEQITTQSLISYYYNEEFSGENFFQILDNLSKNELENLPLIRIAYMILCLGFEGKYAIKSSGQTALKGVKEKIYLLLVKYNQPPFLFVQGMETKSINIFRTSEFQIFGVLIILLCSIYLFFYHSLINKTLSLYELISTYLQT